jgi:hypothetical protein
VITLNDTHTHTHTHTHLVGLLWTRDRPVAEASTWRHTTFTTDRQRYPRRDSNQESQEASGPRPTPGIMQPLGSLIIISFKFDASQWARLSWHLVLLDIDVPQNTCYVTHVWITRHGTDLTFRAMRIVCRERMNCNLMLCVYFSVRCGSLRCIIVCGSSPKNLYKTCKSDSKSKQL